MNCPNCICPNRTGKPPEQFRLKQSIQLVKLNGPDDQDERNDHLQCPQCRAKFWCPKEDDGEQITFNARLTPALL